jgi:bacillithiol biosynthesis deacetylase BshB1
MLDYLCFAPHPDDVELGMGGTLATLLDQGFSVGVCDMTDGEPTPHGSPAVRAAETAAATRAIGVITRVQLGLPNRAVEHTLETRRKAAEVIRRLKPTVLFVPFFQDAHPDHLAVTSTVEAARFHAKLTKTDMAGEPHYPARIIYYYATHLFLVPAPSFVVDCSAAYGRKVAAIEAYQSQFYLNRGDQAGAVLEYVRTRDAYFGSLIGAAYGEPFFVKEPLGLKSLRDVTHGASAVAGGPRRPAG